MALEDFIKTNKAKLISMTREKIAKRSDTPRPRDLEEKHGVHLLLDQLRDALVKAKRDPSAEEADPPADPAISHTAALHGHDLLKLGLSVDEVVHDYGEVCQAVTELAIDVDAPISTEDFHTLNRCLDDAIAAAVTAWSGDRDAALAPNGTHGKRNDEKMRRLVSGAITLVEQLRAGRIAPGGGAASVLGRNLAKMRDLLDGSLS